MLTTEIESGACHCSLEGRGSRWNIISYHSPPPSINVGEFGMASNKFTQISIVLESTVGVTFSPKSDIVPTFSSMIVVQFWNTTVQTGKCLKNDYANT